ncbi:MAG: DNA polymerase III subunit delta' [Turicibacter sp.]|nr:DNA polymerase III subunit delta' [Turicibacter sp.]
MHGWENISSRQTEIVRFLVNSYRKNRLVHAYILEGAKGVGKLFVAKNFAKMLLCESKEQICGTCRSCQMIEASGHVNVYMIRPEGNSIKKEQIQTLQSEFSKMAAENSAKVYIIEEADKMSASAANSLLKFLEEPMPNTYALLLTENKQMLLPTIRSRAIVLSFKSLPREELVKQYCEAGVNQYAAIVASLTQNLDEGVKLAESEGLSLLIDLVLKTEDCLVKTTLDPSILLMQHQHLIKDKETQLLYLKLFMIYYEDVLRMKLGKTKQLAFRLYPSSLSTSERVNTVKSCLNKLHSLLEAEKRLMANANVMLCFDQLFLEMRGGL